MCVDITCSNCRLAWMPLRTRPRSYPSSAGELKEQDDARAAAAVEAAAALVPKPPLEEELNEEKRITFPTQVRFHSAVRQEDNVELFRILSTNGMLVEVNATNHQRLTALHQAVANRNLDTVKILLCHGADCNIQDLKGQSPLHTAAASGLRQAVSLMIVFGANLTLLTNEGLLPVDVAKDNNTANLLMKEMCRQMQEEILLDQYGFIFRGISQWNRFSLIVCDMLSYTWTWLKSFTFEMYNRLMEETTEDKSL